MWTYEGTMIGAKAVGTYYLSLPSGLVLELENCYYARRLIKNIISYDLLIDSGFKFIFENKSILCYKDNVFYFVACSQNGLFTINLQENDLQDNEIYHISKRSRDILDQTYLWHYRLGHINKKHIKNSRKEVF